MRLARLLWGPRHLKRKREWREQENFKLGWTRLQSLQVRYLRRRIDRRKRMIVKVREEKQAQRASGGRGRIKDERVGSAGLFSWLSK